ncbi:MAG TPA: cyanophycinase [Flavobacteriaceae bacterium]|jgi:cyanophycinase|nr:cyanophycinase [Flavobacteriaceae bacterium]MAY52193.1 cyanophycinase [Flavobacteriaceae bacterium]HBR53844.1 cyanophycinase [Flavobacteriaceae bacterium]HIB47059.1 cyanophycinase [Flavobacteriaceae bacterium]HIN99305.1 cyanophycinase [Flavobacteriaceae bacterium]
MKAKGILIPIGGNEDKGVEEHEVYHLEFIEEGILSRVVKESGGIDASIVIIPTASSIPDEVGENYLDAFGKLGCTNLHVMNIRDRDQSETPENIKRMKNADCVMFSGGNQSKITEKIGGTTLHKIMHERYQNEKFVIAGTSAGAMCMSKEMISGGSSQESFIKGAVKMKEGMAFIPELIIDSHFIRRGRFGRMAEAVAKFSDLIGVGLAEDTGVVVKNNTFEVIGSGMVILFNARKAKHNNHHLLTKGTPMSLTNLKTHILAKGDRFNIKKKKVNVSPVELPVIEG